MAPVASKLASKLRSWSGIDECYTTDGKVVMCQVCNKTIGCSMKSQLDQHLRSALHTNNKQRVSSKQVLLTQVGQSGSKSEFFKDMCRAMIAANIPWNKLQVPEYRSFLAKYCSRTIPDESTLRKNYLDECYQDVLATIRSDIQNSYIWIAVDETTDALGRYIANLIVGKLDPEKPSKPHLICSRALEKTNHATIARFVNDGLKVLWPQGIQEDKVLVLYSDAAAYMLKAAKSLKVFYPNVVHFTCLAHALQRVAEEVRSSFTNVNNLIASTKKVFVKAPMRVQYYKENLPHVALPPEPILTRWGTWLEAVTFYNEHFEAIKSIVDSFPPESAASVRDSQNAFSEPSVVSDIAYIHSNFTWIAEIIKKLETVGLPLQESMKIVENAQLKLSSTMAGQIGVRVSGKLHSVLKRNPGYSRFLSVCKIMDGEQEELPEDISPSKFHLLKYAPVTSCDVERSFSAYKRILSDQRQSMTMENMEKYLVTNCASR